MPSRQQLTGMAEERGDEYYLKLFLLLTAYRIVNILVRSFSSIYALRVIIRTMSGMRVSCCGWFDWMGGGNDESMVDGWLTRHDYCWRVSLSDHHNFTFTILHEVLDAQIIRFNEFDETTKIWNWLKKIIEGNTFHLMRRSYNTFDTLFDSF